MRNVHEKSMKNLRTQTINVHYLLRTLYDPGNAANQNLWETF